MEKGLRLSWRHIPPSEPVAQRVRDLVDRLHRFHGHITGCAVTLEKPSSHHRHAGPQYRVRVELTVPGGRVVVGRDPAETLTHADLYAAVNAAFREVQRQLRELTRRGHRLVKTHAEPVQGKVLRLFPAEGYGFLATLDGREIYFHRKSVLNGGFAKLRVGSTVRMVEEAGVEGPQASTVVPLRGRARAAGGALPAQPERGP